GVPLRRDSGTEGSRRSNVGILVSSDVQAFSACLFDGGDNIFHFAGILFAAALEVEDLNGNVGFASDLEGFVKRVHFFIAFITDMAGVDSALFRGGFCESDEFVSLRVRTGSVDERATYAHGAVVHGVADHERHSLELVGSGSTIIVADDVVAELSGADVCAEVD